MRLAAVIAVAGVLAASAAASVERGTLLVSRGAAGVALGMTRAQVIAKLGKPLYQNANGYMEYSRANLFDVYLDGAARVRLISVSGRNFCTPRGVCVLRDGGIGRLKAQYGKGLRLVTAENGERLYVLVGRYRGRRAFTSFGFGPKGRILQVFVGWCPARPARCGA